MAVTHQGIVGIRTRGGMEDNLSSRGLHCRKPDGQALTSETDGSGISRSVSNKVPGGRVASCTMSMLSCMMDSCWCRCVRRLHKVFRKSGQPCVYLSQIPKCGEKMENHCLLSGFEG